MKRLVELLVVLVVALFLFLALGGDHPEVTPIRSYILENGVAETGARNLVTAVYLGYRAFDTLGETVVLVVAVSGVMFFVERKR
ncbi:MAG: hydrogen gas-evolving membrane-bound hydrogenase subunit E [bacterium]